jgi:hypothetical protein
MVGWFTMYRSLKSVTSVHTDLSVESEDKRLTSDSRGRQSNA